MATYEDNAYNWLKRKGLGNDHLYVFVEVPDNASGLKIRPLERHFGQARTT